MEELTKGHRSVSDSRNAPASGKRPPQRPDRPPPERKPSRKRLEEALRESEARVALDLESLRRLHEAAMRLIGQHDLAPLLEEALDAAIEISRADFGNIYLLDPGSGALRMAAHRGFPTQYLEYFRKGRGKAHAVVRAVDRGECVLVEDIADNPLFAFTYSQRVLLEAGARSLASTPLMTRDRRMQGALTVHWREPHHPGERALRFLDLLAAQAADAIERVRAEEALARSEERYGTLFQAIEEGFCIVEIFFDGEGKPIDGRFLETNPAFERLTGLVHAHGKRILDLVPQQEREWLDILGKAARTGDAVRFQSHAAQLHGWYEICAFRYGKPEERQVALLFDEINDRKRIEAALREDEKRFRRLFDQSPFGAALIDPGFRTLEVNRNFSKITGYSPRELARLAFSDFTHPGDLEADLAQAGRLLAGEIDQYELEKRFIRKDGTIVWTHLYVRGIRDEEGRLLYFMPLIEDITEKKRMREALEESEETARRRQQEIEAIYASARVGLCLLDTDMRFVRVNDRFAEMNGVPVSMHVGRSFREVVPGLSEAAEGLIRRVVETGKPVLDSEFTGETPARPGAKRTWIGQWIPMKSAEGTVVGINVVAEDITDRVATQEALLALVAEKDILLRELSHRTKNNMQVIVGLLGLQAARSEDADLLEALAKAQDRIRAMALVHEKLYRSGNVSTLSMKEYLKDLVTTVLRTHQGARGPVRPLLELEEVFLSIDEALPCGLIVNELLSNSLKHAFPGGKDGTVRLSLRRTGERVEIRYGDDGPGLAAGQDPPAGGSLGLRLVHNLATHQLRGNIEFGRGPGMQVAVAFPMPLFGNRT